MAFDTSATGGPSSQFLSHPSDVTHSSNPTAISYVSTSDIRVPVPGGNHPARTAAATCIASNFKGYRLRGQIFRQAQDTPPYESQFQFQHASHGYAPRLSRGELTDSVTQSRALATEKGSRTRASEWDRYRSTAALPALGLPGFHYKSSNYIQFSRELAAHGAPPDAGDRGGASPIKQLGHVHTPGKTTKTDMRGLNAWMLGLAHNGVPSVLCTRPDDENMRSSHKWTANHKSGYAMEVVGLLQTGCYSVRSDLRNRKVLAPGPGAARLMLSDVKTALEMRTEDEDVLKSHGLLVDRCWINIDVSTLLDIKARAAQFDALTWLENALSADLTLTQPGFPVLEGFERSGLFLPGELVVRMLKDVPYGDSAAQDKALQLVARMVQSPHDSPLLLGVNQGRHVPSVTAHLAVNARNLQKVVMPSRSPEHQRKLQVSLPRMIDLLPSIKAAPTRQEWISSIRREANKLVDLGVRTQMQTRLEAAEQEAPRIMKEITFSNRRPPILTEGGDTLNLHLDSHPVHVAADMPFEFFLPLWDDCLTALTHAPRDPYPEGFARYEWCGSVDVQHQGKAYHVFFEGNGFDILDMSICWKRSAGSGTESQNEASNFELFRLRELQG